MTHSVPTKMSNAKKFDWKGFYERNYDWIKIAAIVVAIGLTLLLIQWIFFKAFKDSNILEWIFEYSKAQFKGKSMTWLFIIAMLDGFLLMPIAIDIFFMYYIAIGADPITTIIVAFAGIMLSRSLDFWFGHLFKGYAYRNFIKEDAKKFEERFDKWGSAILFFGTFIPFFPMEMMIVFIGTTGYKFYKFLAYHGISRIIKLLAMMWIVRALIDPQAAASFDVIEFMKNMV